jgi:hypothetical protein
MAAAVGHRHECKEHCSYAGKMLTTMLMLHHPPLCVEAQRTYIENNQYILQFN